MKLILHTPDSDNNLSHYYQIAFKEAIELFIVTAYLTEWDASLKLNPKCGRFRVIIAKDFGITRKAACESLMRWLPCGVRYGHLVSLWQRITDVTHRTIESQHCSPDGAPLAA